MKLLLIRHGYTAGNLEKRYIGKTDEPLCTEGIAQLSAMRYPACEKLICSPMLRCLQTASILFPNQKYCICDDFRECEFGDFEGKNYNELQSDPRYQQWIDSSGTLPFPNGESPDDFRRRCIAAFAKIMQQCEDYASAALIVHGGTIMSILSCYAVPRRSYFDWQTENGHGWLCEFQNNIITIMEKL